MTEPFATPGWLIQALLNALELDCFDLDPCSPFHPTVPAMRWYTKWDDGLALPWRARTVFCNPPYDDLPTWVLKAISEHLARCAERIIMLVPTRPETKPFGWIHDAGGRIVMLRKRLKFGNHTSTHRVGSTLFLLGFTEEEIIAVRRALPQTWILVDGAHVSDEGTDIEVELIN